MNRAVTLADRLKSSPTYLCMVPEDRPQSWRELMEDIIQGKVANREEARGLAQSCGVMADESRRPLVFISKYGERWELFVMGRVSDLNGGRELSNADRQILRNEVLKCADEADEWERTRDSLSEDQA